MFLFLFVAVSGCFFLLSSLGDWVSVVVPSLVFSFVLYRTTESVCTVAVLRRLC